MTNLKVTQSGMSLAKHSNSALNSNGVTSFSIYVVGLKQTFGLIFVWAIFVYQFSYQLFVCCNFVHFWRIKMLQTLLQYPFCCIISVFVVHFSVLASYSEAKQ